MNGFAVRAIRIKENLTQTEFAEKLRVSPSLISGIESGQRRVTRDMRIKIAQVFGTGDEIDEAIARARESEKWAQ